MLWLMSTLAALVGCLPVAVTLCAQESWLETLPAFRDFESRRITSADPTGRNEDFRVLEPGGTLILADIPGPGCIVHFRDNITSQEPHHLQLHVLRMFWDGEQAPSVEAPVGDFFAVGFGLSEKFSSALMCIDQRPGRLLDPAAFGAARNCYIPMPFTKSARITLTNEGKQPSRHWYEVNYRTYRQPAGNRACFHAQYRQATPPVPGPYTILEAQGRGHLLGCVLSVKNNDGGWWGEGDEIVFVDGKQTIQGTGSEDYFCESYGLRPGCFPYFGVTLLEEPYVTAYRWHVPDPVVFGESIRFLIEHGDGNPPFRSGNYYYSVAYWYQSEPHGTFPKLPTVAERLSWATNCATGVLEGEALEIRAKTGGVSEVQTDMRWSGGRQLWWRDGKVGDKLELSLPVQKAGNYRLVMHNTRAFDYGIFQFYLDGEKLGEPLDLYSAQNITRLATLGARQLSQGDHRLRIEIVGANPAAKPRYMLGLDYLRFEAVQ
jgi:hypothetical protein